MIYTREELIHEVQKVLIKYKIGNSLVVECSEKIADLVATINDDYEDPVGMGLFP